MNQSIVVNVESVDLEGNGIARLSDGKTVFIAGALPNEEVAIEIYKKKPKFDLGRLIEIIKPSKDRVVPECPNFGMCGGCSFQHLDWEAQIFNKQKVLIDNLKHIGNVETINILPPINGEPWGYRHRARLSVKYVLKKESVLVGFREKASVYVANMNECKVLPKTISDLIPQLRQLIEKLSIKNRIPQIEVAVGEKVNILVLRNMESLIAEDENILKIFVIEYNNINNFSPIQVWLQPSGPDSCYPFYPLDMPRLTYELKNYAIEMPYFPAEFTQVNPTINEEMVRLAMQLLDPKPADRIADFFCGIGNFTLPIAKYAKYVMGIEGSQQLVTRALENAKFNQLEKNVTYQMNNLFKIDEEWITALGKFDKWLIDPPRDGAKELISSINVDNAPQRIVYISCNPATLARDAGILVSEKEYLLSMAGVINMFPHTSHIESIAVFNLN